jgi:hypothetical protein
MNTLQRITIPLLRNGSVLKASKCDESFIVVRETCAFDSLTQVMINAIVTNETYAEVATVQNNNFCNFAKNISMINSNKITSNIYQERAKILSGVSLFEKTPYRKNVTQLNANCNVSQLAEHLFIDFPSLIISKKCKHCNHEDLRKVPVLNINVDILLRNGISALQNSIIDNNEEKDSMCKKCHQSVHEKYTFQSHLLVDSTTFSDKRYAALIGIKKKNPTLKSIPHMLNTNGQNYIIPGMVSHKPYVND